MNQIKKPCLVVIGGSSGIGLALALKHDELGWDVVVVGSSRTKIESLNNNHPHLQTLCMDITDKFMHQKLFNFLTPYKFDRLIYAAGWYLNERKIELNHEDSQHMLAINLQAFNSIFEWASSELINRQTNSNFKPALICIASVAGLFNYPYASLYAKCKSAMIATSSAYRLALIPFGIQVNCIAMGYVNTKTLRELNNGDASHKPFIVEESEAVEHIMRAIDHNQELYIFPKQIYYLTKLLNTIPKPVLNYVMRRKLDK